MQRPSLRLRQFCPYSIKDANGYDIPCPANYKQPASLSRHCKQYHHGATKRRVDNTSDSLSSVAVSQPSPNHHHGDSLPVFSADAPVAGPSWSSSPQEGGVADGVFLAPAAHVTHPSLDFFDNTTYWPTIDPLLTNRGQQFNPMLEAAMQNYLLRTMNIAEPPAPCEGFDLAAAMHLQSQWPAFSYTRASSPTSSLFAPSPPPFFEGQEQAPAYGYDSYAAPDLPQFGNI